MHITHRFFRGTNMNKKVIIFLSVATCFTHLGAMEKPLIISQATLNYLKKEKKPKFQDKSIGVFRNFIDSKTGVDISYSSYMHKATRDDLIFVILPGSSTYATIYKNEIRFYGAEELGNEHDSAIVFNPEHATQILKSSAARFQLWQDNKKRFTKSRFMPNVALETRKN